MTLGALSQNSGPWEEANASAGRLARQFRGQMGLRPAAHGQPVNVGSYS